MAITFWYRDFTEEEWNRLIESAKKRDLKPIIASGEVITCTIETDGSELE